jgi:hypothetical protein
VVLTVVSNPNAPTIGHDGAVLERAALTADGHIDWSRPPAGAISTGDGHAYVRLWWPMHPYPQSGHPDDATWVGIDEWHRNADGRWCVGYCLFAVPEADAWAHAYVGDVGARWTVSFDPLTMAPSIACRVCPSHGFIRQGRWSGT